MLKKMTTTPFGGHQAHEDVIAQVSSQPSVPQPEPQLAEALQSICISLASGKGGKMHNPDEIAEILQVHRRQVETFLEANKGSGASAHKDTTEIRATTNPVFNEVLQTLLPEVPELGVVEVCVLQKKSQVVATGVIHLRDLLKADSLRIDGPIRLEFGAADANIAEAIGSCWLRWLE